MGNILATITDGKLWNDSLNGYLAEVVSATDYEPFGLALDGRSLNNERYRYGFNGKENDGDFSFGIQDYGFRLYSRKLAKFLSVDPLTASYPWYTPYQFAGNMPIWASDLDGLEELLETTNETKPKQALQPGTYGLLLQSTKEVSKQALKKEAGKTVAKKITEAVVKIANASVSTVAATAFFVFTPANSGSDYSRDTNVGNKSTLHAEPKPLSEADISLILKNANSIQANKERDLAEMRRLVNKNLTGGILLPQEQRRLQELWRQYPSEANLVSDEVDRDPFSSFSDEDLEDMREDFVENIETSAEVIAEILKAQNAGIRLTDGELRQLLRATEAYKENVILYNKVAKEFRNRGKDAPDMHEDSIVNPKQ